MRRQGSTFLLVLLMLSSSFLFAAREKRKTKAVYCSLAANGAWHVQGYKPLINPAAGMTFAEISFAGRTVEAVRLRRFHPEYEVVFDYKFDANGRLSGLLGSVAMWGRWVAVANLYPEADGTVGSFHVKYYKPGTEDQIARPEDAEYYTAELSRVPVYRTIESLPCAGSLQDAEKMNATQE
jgi:hypothetical protein